MTRGIAACSARTSVLCAFFFSAVMAADARSASQPAGSIAHVQGDLYRVAHGQHTTVFLVTTDGIVLVDPLNTPFSQWLKAQLAARFPGRSVRYIVHTDHRFDRAGGAWTFRDTATRVAHRAFNSELKRSRSSGPYDDIASVATTYEDSHAIVLADKRVEVLHVHDPSVPELTIVYFPTERVVFAPYPSLASLPASFAPSTPKHLLARVRALEQLDADLLISPRGDIDRKQDLIGLRRYLEDLIATVRSGRISRRSLTALETALTAGAQNPAERQRHLGEAYVATTTTAADVYVVGHVNKLQRADVCAMYLPPCVGTGGTATGVGAGVRVSFGGLGGVVEVTPGKQFTGHVRVRDRSSPSFQSEPLDLLFEHRETLISMLFRYELMHDRRLTMGVLAGPSILLQEGRRFNVTRSPLGDSVAHVVEEQPSQLGFTVGAEPTLYFGERFGFIAPVRLTRANRLGRLTGVGGWSVHLGAGLVVTVNRTAR